MKKIALLLSLLMLVSPIAMTACSESAVNNEDTTPQASVDDPESASGTEEETGKYIDQGYRYVVNLISGPEEETEPTITDIVKEKYAGNDLQGYEYRVLAPGNGEHFYNNVAANTNEVYAEEMNGEAINDAVYNRNLDIESRFEIKLECAPDAEPHNTVKTMVTAGTNDYDLAGMSAYACASSLLAGLLTDLNTIDNLDMSKSWWDQYCNEECTFGINPFECLKIYISLIHCVYGVRDNVQQIQYVTVVTAAISDMDKSWYTSS